MPGFSGQDASVVRSSVKPESEPVLPRMAAGGYRDETEHATPAACPVGCTSSLFLTLIALAVAVVRAALRNMPGGVSAWFARWSYEALVLMLAAAFVTFVVLLTRKGKAPRIGEEP
jgi:hypothetical protein